MCKTNLTILLLLLAFSSTSQTISPPPPSNVLSVTEGRAFLSTDNLVVTYVFGWYTETGGQINGVWHPLEGRLEWDGSVSFWKRQVKDMMDANIDLIYVHLIDAFTSERANLYRALRDLRLEGYQVPQIAPWLDPSITFHPTSPNHLGSINLCLLADRNLFIEQYENFYLDYFSINPDGESFLATMNGKPMLNMWSLGSVANPSVINPSCMTRQIFESELVTRLGLAFQGGVYFASISDPHGFNWADEFNRAFTGYTGGYYVQDNHVSVIKPGVWARPPHGHVFLARNGGTGYVNGWDDLIADINIHQVQIESWNEYTESTGIFEADSTKAYWLEDGYLEYNDFWGPTARHYIDLTAEKGAEFNNIPELDSILPYADQIPTSVTLGKPLQLQVVIRNTGDEQWRGYNGFALSLDWGNGFKSNFPINDNLHEIDQRDDPLFAGEGGYGGVFRGRSIVFNVEVTAPTLSGLYRPRWYMEKNGVAFGGELDQIVRVGEADVCDYDYTTTTVHGTLGIGAYGTNYFCGDLGKPLITADFICNRLGHPGALDYISVAKPRGSYCAYKTEHNEPYFGLLGNWGHGSKVISHVSCGTNSCGTPFYPTTVHGTLGIPAYGTNCFAGDLGKPKITADFICAQKGFDRSIGYRTGPKTDSTHCAYKTSRSIPNFGLLGNFGHGIEQLTEVRCITD